MMPVVIDLLVCADIGYFQGSFGNQCNFYGQYIRPQNETPQNEVLEWYVLS